MAKITGTENSDYLNGTSTNDVILGRGGDRHEDRRTTCEARFASRAHSVPIAKTHG
jgi:hypothetical protein